jgi:hypothetical protein
MAEYKVRQKFATIREAVVKADSVEEALEIASHNSDSLFPEEAATYVETEFDAWDEDGTLFIPAATRSFRIGR